MISKINKLLIAGVIITSLVLPAPIQAQASQINEEKKIENTINQYFHQREKDTINPKYTKEEKIELKEFAKSNIVEFEKNRKDKYRNMENKLDIKIVHAKVTSYLDKIEVSDDQATAYYYEWITMDYKGTNEKLDYMGMGTWHKVTLLKENGQWVISEVSYDEGPLTEVTTADLQELYNGSNHNAGKVNQAGLESSDTLDPNDITLHSSVASKRTEDFTIQYVPDYVPYNRNGVVAYSDKWIKPGAWGTNYETYYNPAYKNFNPAGGDCANFVSQSMHEGGTLPMIGKSTHSKASGAWWYDNKGTTTTTDDLVTENWSWTGAHYHRTHIYTSYGTSTKDAPTSLDILKGNPVYYDWAGDGWYDHVTIAVGTNASGVPIVNSHNKDYNRVHWNYGGSSCKYSTVKIVNEYYSPEII